MYSHDTFGLGHLRRTRAIAHALVDHAKHTSVLIISGSSIAGAFDFKARVDFIKIPSVIKLHNGDYTSLSDHIDISDTLAMRRSIIESAAVNFRPDVFIVDKEPRGLRGELDPTLPRLKSLGCVNILGLRDVLDEPDAVRHEWERNEAASWVDRYFDRIWVYGSRDFWNPLQGVELAPSVTARIEHVGFLARSVPAQPFAHEGQLPKAYVLVTAGGGGDGAELMRAVLAAHEHDRSLRFPMVFVCGPFMSQREKLEIRHRAQRLQSAVVLDFENNLEHMIQRATAVVAMGGYNTFCELMSFDKRALIVPRKVPRQEQLIRAMRAKAFGLVEMIDPDQAKNPRALAAVLQRLPTRPRPSESSYAINLDGLTRIAEDVDIVRSRSEASRPRAYA
ncbi:MAG: glycosyltransferase family protein [Hyphomicrobiaceae bacterium]